MNDFIRNGIAAFAIVVTLGGGGLKFYTDFLALQTEFYSLQRTVDAIYCKLDPQSIVCSIFKKASMP